MIFPLSLSDVSLWLGVTTIIVVVTSVLIGLLPDYSPRILINKRILRLIGIACGLAFMLTVILRVITIV